MGFHQRFHGTTPPLPRANPRTASSDSSAGGWPVPVGIVGTYGVLPKHSWWIHGGCDVTIRFGDPIPTAGVRRNELMARVREAMKISYR